MTLLASNRLVGNVTIVDLAGRITLGDGSVVLRDTVRELVNDGRTRLLVDLAGVSYIDSAGIGELVGAYTTVRNKGGEMKLLNLTQRVKDLLQVTKLLTVFENYTDETTAVQSFGK